MEKSSAAARMMGTAPGDPRTEERAVDAPIHVEAERRVGDDRYLETTGITPLDPHPIRKPSGGRAGRLGRGFLERPGERWTQRGIIWAERPPLRGRQDRERVARAHPRESHEIDPEAIVRPSDYRGTAAAGVTDRVGMLRHRTGGLAGGSQRRDQRRSAGTPVGAMECGSAQIA
jgi:hypothetical protein